MDNVPRQRVLRALQERSPGEIREERSATSWALLSGAPGKLLRSGERLLVCDGSPGLGDGDGAWSLLHGMAPTGSAAGSGKVRLNPEGVAGLLSSAWGSFAACMHDGNSGDVLLIRDRLGTRPLFYVEMKGRLLVASECKVLQALGVPLDVDADALREALVYRWVSGTSCLLAPVVRVPEASFVHFRPGSPSCLRRYWRFGINSEPMSSGALGRYRDEIEAALRASLANLNRGSPRVGVLLSGGVDSSILAALARDEFGSCIAFAGWIPGFENREFERARAVANHLGVDFRGVEIDVEKIGEDLPYVVRRIEELPRHPNNLVLVQLLRHAGKEVDLLLQGDAADTLFGLSVLRSLRHFSRKRARLERIPRWLLRSAAGLLERVPMKRAVDLARVLAWDESRYARHRDAISYSPRLRNMLGLTFLNPAVWESGDWHPQLSVDGTRRVHLMSSGIEGSLIRHDRLSSPEGIESVAPFLSPEVMDLASRFPRELYGGEGNKPVLRALCDRLLPAEVSRWPKIGFEVPTQDWLFGVFAPLCKEADDALLRTGLLPNGFFRAALRLRDKEGVFSGLCLYLLIREFGLSRLSLAVR